MLRTIDNIELPEELLASLDEGRLVVFVGAGVSAKAYPKQKEGTWYPDFRGLAYRVAAKLTKEIQPSDRKLIDDGFVDRVLGEWEDDNNTVHHLVSEILQENESFQKLDLHRAIVRLFKSGKTPRIVTTNFDRLLIRAIEAEGLLGRPEWRITAAPSLPPPRRLVGLCFLHGRVDDPEDIVLTDKDIGRAYMDEGWALRFAHSMFQRFDVLFVGYSLEDPPIRYLSLALEGATTKLRWAFIDSSGGAATKQNVERNWKRRNVQPIWFPAWRKNYRACERAISAWADVSAKTFLDRRNILTGFGRQRPVDLKPHDLSRIAFFLKDSANLRDFAALDLEPGWLVQLIEWGHLNHLLGRQAGSVLSEAEFNLVQRLVTWMLNDQVGSLPNLSLDRGRLHPAIFTQFLRRISEDKESSLQLVQICNLLEFLRPSVEANASTMWRVFADPLLRRLFDEGQVLYGIWLVEILVKATTQVSKRPNYDYESLKARGDSTVGLTEFVLRYESRFVDNTIQHWIGRLFEEVLKDRIREVAPLLIPRLTWQLILLRWVGGRFGQELASEHVRAAIETHDQDKYRNDPVNLIVNLIRDCWFQLFSVDAAAAKDVYLSWMTARDGIVERLRIYALTVMVEQNAIK